MSQTGSDSAGIEIIARCAWVDRGRVLVCRSLENGYCYLPGGHVEPGETAAAALSRELIEEAGIELAFHRPTACFEQLFTQKGKPRHELTFVFHVEHAADFEIHSRESHISFEWIDLAALVGEDLRPPAIKAWLMSNGADSAASMAWMSHDMREHPDPT